jgi:UDP-GlcNAc:undecaprenyl-phosphate/decaprenyl-phosphate GlcNAc-1-phosphate transferase
VWGSLIFTFVLLVVIQLLVESIGLIGTEHRPLMKFLKARRNDS